MKTKTLIPILTLLIYSFSYSQVGIGTTNPEGALHIQSTTKNIHKIDKNIDYI